MTAQPVHHAPLPRIPETVKGIRQHLSAAQREVFADELGEAIDTGGMDAVQRVKDRWWGRAMYATNPQLQADLDALARGELELVASPFAR